MKHFKVVLIKIEKIVGCQPAPAQLIEQEYYTNKDFVNIQIPPGYGVISCTEILKTIYQYKDEKKISSN